MWQHTLIATHGHVVTNGSPLAVVEDFDSAGPAVTLVEGAPPETNGLSWLVCISLPFEASTLKLKAKYREKNKTPEPRAVSFREMRQKQT